MAVPISRLHGSTANGSARRAGERGRHPGAHRAAKHAAAEQRTAIEQAVAGNKWRRIAATTIAMLIMSSLRLTGDAPVSYFPHGVGEAGSAHRNASIYAQLQMRIAPLLLLTQSAHLGLFHARAIDHSMGGGLLEFRECNDVHREINAQNRCVVLLCQECASNITHPPPDQRRGRRRYSAGTLTGAFSLTASIALRRGR